jgi:hypothetical protein
MKKNPKPKSSGFLTKEEAISEKISQLKKVLKGDLSEKELSALITKRRITWLKENLDYLLKKHKNLLPVERAYHILYHDHMNIDPSELKVTMISPNKIRIDNYNFCPYLETAKKLGLETREMCKNVNHECFEKSVKEIHPKLTFYRKYRNIRPHCDYCEEYIELLED